MRARAVVIVRLRVWAGGWISPGSVTAQKPSLPDSSHWSTTSGVAAVELVAEGVLAAACGMSMCGMPRCGHRGIVRRYTLTRRG